MHQTKLSALLVQPDAQCSEQIRQCQICRLISSSGSRVQYNFSHIHGATSAVIPALPSNEESGSPSDIGKIQGNCLGEADSFLQGKKC